MWCGGGHQRVVQIGWRTFGLEVDGVEGEKRLALRQRGSDVGQIEKKRGEKGRRTITRATALTLNKTHLIIIQL